MDNSSDELPPQAIKDGVTRAGGWQAVKDEFKVSRSTIDRWKRGNTPKRDQHEFDAFLMKYVRPYLGEDVNAPQPPLNEEHAAMVWHWRFVLDDEQRARWMQAHRAAKSKTDIAHEGGGGKPNRLSESAPSSPADASRAASGRAV